MTDKNVTLHYTISAHVGDFLHLRSIHLFVFFSLVHFLAFKLCATEFCVGEQNIFESRIPHCFRQISVIFVKYTNMV